MKLLHYGKDGGPKSTVYGFWLVEIKSLFSIVLLRFEPGSREVYHSHAFNAFTWFLKGQVREYLWDGTSKVWNPSFKPKYTPRNCVHKVFGLTRTWALSIRGPWTPTWIEFDDKARKVTTFTHGRRVVS